MSLSLVCLTTSLTIILRAVQIVFAEDTSRKLPVCLSHRHHLVLHDSCIFRRFRIQQQQSPVAPHVARAPSRSSQRSRANSGYGSPQGGHVPKRERSRSNPTLPKRQPMKVAEDVSPVPSRTSRTRAKSTFASSNVNTSTPVSAGECYRRWSA